MAGDMYVLGQPFLELDEVGSTNDYLKERALLDGLPHGTAVLAHAQTAGKGRLGRSWEAERGKSLAMSVLLRPFDPANMGCLPLLAALGVRRGLEAACGAEHGFAIKWSNDILLGERKICGILCESRGDFAVVGIGVNVGQDEAELARHGLVYAGSLFAATQKYYEILPLAREILRGFGEILHIYRQTGFDGLCGEYRRHCVNLGREVRVLRGGEETHGRAVDVAADGSLVLENEAGERVRVVAGEASVRGLMGYVDR